MMRLAVVLCALVLLGQPSRSSDVPQHMVKNWASSFGNIISEVCIQNTARNNISEVYERKSSIDIVDGMEMLSLMTKNMINMMDAKINAVKRIVDTAENAAMSHMEQKQLDVSYFNAKKLNEYVTIRNNITLKDGYKEFRLGNSSKHFSGIPVNMTHSTVHVPTNVFDRSMDVNNTIAWSAVLDRTFQSNFEKDPSLSWQYFGSSTGIMRQFPGVKWLVDQNEPDMYDCRMREWYIRAASSPKDVIILLDLSGSMTGLRVEIAKHVVLNILDTLNANDYVNIYNFSQSADPPLVPCFNNTLVQANLENVRIFKDHLDNVTTRGLANFTMALTEAFSILNKARATDQCSKCNQAIMLVTDGAPEKYEQVFNTFNRPNIRVRLFTYLIGRDVADREAVEWMACANKGYFTHVTTLAEVREQVQKYVPVLARPLVLSSVGSETSNGQTSQPTSKHPVIWTGVYADIADPKLTDWLWEIRERERQYHRSENYKELLKRSAGPADKVDGRSRQQCYKEMQTFLEYRVERLNKTERERMEAQRYRETKLDLRETELSDKWTLHIGRTDSETTQRGYRLMTSISIPVFDKIIKPRKSIARLLGVAGTDVPLSDLQKHAPPHMLGVNGYSFIIDNNGYVLYHPDLRPVHREATKQFQEILKPNYKTVDLTEVEIVDSDEPRNNDSKLFELRKSMIDGGQAQTSLYVRQHLDRMKRVIQRKQKYFFMSLRPSPFSLAIVMPERYGDKRIKGEVELTQAAKQHGMRDQIRRYFEGPNWSVHPEWVYCEYYNDAHSLDTPRSQYLHFLEKAMTTPGFEWRSQRMYPAKQFKETNEPSYRTGERKPKSYFCDRDLFQSVIFDAEVTMPFKLGRGQSLSKHPLAPFVAQMTREKLFRTFGAVHSFVATRSGFTRWKSHWPADMNKDDVELDALNFSAVRATDEVWYKRAVNYHEHDPQAFVYSVPFDAGLRNESLVTVAQAVYVRKGMHSAPAAVVGMQFLHSSFREKFLSTASCPSLGNCSQTCASDSLDCYLLDDSGFVLVSKRPEETGKFFGDVDGTVMDALLQHKVYSKIRMFDYQGVCLDVISTGSSAWTLMTPVRYLRWLISWTGAKLLWLLVQSNLLQLIDINLAWAAEKAVNEYSGADQPAVQHAPTVITDDMTDEDTCVHVSTEGLFQMAHINKTRPRPCDKHVSLYTLNTKTKPVKASLEHCYGMELDSCKRGFVMEKVPLTNLLMLVVNALCPCESQVMSIEPQEWQYPENTTCERLLLEPYRRRPSECTHYHVGEESLSETCGRSGVTSLAAALSTVWLLMLLVTLLT